MREYVESLIARYRKKGILIDTNLLLLFFVGSYDPLLVGKAKRVRQFVLHDYQLIVNIVDSFETVVTTPNILTEVSNFTAQLPVHDKEACFMVFSRLVSSFEESYQPSKNLCDLPPFPRFGLTDTAIIDLSPGQHLVLTDDFRLSGYLQNIGVDAINFNHIRTLNWR